MDTTKICFWILQSILWFLITPFALYYTYVFWKLYKQNIPFFTKRHGELVVISCILFLLYPNIIRPAIEITRLYNVMPDFHPITLILANSTTGYMVLCSLRFWLLYFDYTHSSHSLKLKWKEQILKENTHIPWTIKYKWMGNVKILSIIATSFYIFMILIILLVAMVFGTKAQVYAQIVPFVYLFCFMILVVKIRKCRDQFMIQKEFMVFGIAVICVMAFYCAIVIPWFEPFSNPRRILVIICTCGGTYCAGFIPTHWVVRQYYKQLAMQNQSTAKQNVQKILNLEQILSTKDGFDLLADHLVKEFSIENLFFIFEMIQIKNELINHQLIDKNKVGAMINIHLNRISNIRRRDSHIYNIDEMKQNLKYIIKQYIENDGEFCINISAKIRRNLLNDYQKSIADVNNVIELQTIAVDVQQKEQMNPSNSVGESIKNKRNAEVIKSHLLIFDKAMEEIITLVQSDSLPRFYLTNQYQTLS